jgi:hypothetical protein
MKHYLVLTALPISAVLFYTLGSIVGATSLICVGVALELGFWFNLFNRRRQKSLTT